MKYRPEIDGLRAFAVVPVILFHAGFNLFSGGFVGVDIFFVISGYLITTIIIEDLERKKFSLAHFYERRARRILPALFFVMFACIPFAWMWTIPVQMEDFSKSIIFVIFFSSNILFAQKIDYFDRDAEENPLLHTWSLAVEEQYYFIFPIILFLCWRFGKAKVFWIIVVLAGVSLTLSELGWRYNTNANFYFTPSRAWELFVGSIAAFIVQKRGIKSNNTLSVFGLIAILYAILYYDKTTPFPSAYALVPVTGIFLILLYADTETFTAKFLSSKLFISIGLISYSAYLWHQPLLAFARIRLEQEPDSSTIIFILVATTILSLFTWRYIERPFRDQTKISKKSLITTLSVSVLLLLSFALVGDRTKGFRKNSNSEIPPLSVTKSRVINQQLFVIGDSHAEHLIPGLEKFNGGQTVDMTSPGCIPFRDVDRYDDRFEHGECARIMNNNIDTLNAIDKPSIVVISSMGPVYLDGTVFKGKDPARVQGLGVELVSDPTVKDHYKIFEIGMRQTLSELAKNDHLKVIFTIDIPELGIESGCNYPKKEISVLGYKLRDLLSNPPKSECTVSLRDYNLRSGRYKDLIYRIAKDYPSIHLFDPTEHFCDAQSCSGYAEDFGYLYHDFDHLSDNGSYYYASKLMDEVFAND